MNLTEVYHSPKSKAKYYSHNEPILVKLEEIRVPIVVIRTNEDEAQFLIKYNLIFDEQDYEINALRLFQDQKNLIWEKFKKSYLTSGMFKQTRELDFNDIGICYDEDVPSLYFFEKKDPDVKRKIVRSTWMFSFV